MLFFGSCNIKVRVKKLIQNERNFFAISPKTPFPLPTILQMFFSVKKVSNFKSQISLLFHESASYYKIVPCNETHSLWFDREHQLILAIFFGASF